MTDGEASADERGGEGDERRESGGEEEGDDASHLDDLEDGAGCTEIWERLSERREE